MSYAQAQAALNALPPDADKLAYAGATVYDWRTCFVSYRTIRALLAAFDPDTAKAKTEAIAAAVLAGDPIAHQLLSVPGDPLGNGGGVDLSLPESRAMVATLQANGLFTADEANAFLDFSRTNPRPRYAAEWGLSAFDQAALDRLPDWVAWESLAAAVDGLLAEVDATLAFAAGTPTAAVTLRGTAPAGLPAAREALQALVQTYRTTLDDGGDVSDIPADADAAWQRVTQGGA